MSPYFGFKLTSCCFHTILLTSVSLHAGMRCPHYDSHLHMETYITVVTSLDAKACCSVLCTYVPLEVIAYGLHAYELRWMPMWSLLLYYNLVALIGNGIFGLSNQNSSQNEETHPIQAPQLILSKSAANAWHPGSSWAPLPQWESEHCHRAAHSGVW